MIRAFAPKVLAILRVPSLWRPPAQTIWLAPFLLQLQPLLTCALQEMAFSLAVFGSKHHSLRSNMLSAWFFSFTVQRAGISDWEVHATALNGTCLAGQGSCPLSYNPTALPSILFERFDEYCERLRPSSAVSHHEQAPAEALSLHDAVPMPIVSLANGVCTVLNITASVGDEALGAVSRAREVVQGAPVLSGDQSVAAMRIAAALKVS